MYSLLKNCFLISLKSLAILASTKLLLNSNTKPPIKASSVLVVNSTVANLVSAFTLSSIDFFNSAPTSTAVVKDQLITLFDGLMAYPGEFKPLKKVEKLIQDKIKLFQDQQKIDWATAELLAYASLLKDWFEVDPNVIQSLFEQNIQYLDLLQGCTNAVENLDGTNQGTKALAFPNPSVGMQQLKFKSNGAHYEIFIVNQQGKVEAKIHDAYLGAGQQILSFNLQKLAAGTYYYLLKSAEKQELVAFQKL